MPPLLRTRSPVARAIAPTIAAAVLAALLAPATGAWAQRADRSQPLTIEADKSSTVDLAKQVVVFTGNVVITQGSMRIQADRVEVRESPEGWRSALATGTPAKFRQKRDGVDETIEGQAARIEYEGRIDTVRLSGGAVLRRLRGTTPTDEVSGELITYDNANELFSASAGGADGRVRAVLTPQGNDAKSPLGGGLRK
jgi:lipopolysaccharide export system protein LptA